MDIFSSETYFLLQAGTEVITITATDRDGGDFGTDGIRYEMTGSDVFSVDPNTGKITVAPCEESCLVGSRQSWNH